MNRDSADALIARAYQLRTERASWDQKAAEIASVMRPLRSEIGQTLQADGKRTAKLFDGTAILANMNLAGGLYGTMTNPANIWGGFETLDPDLNRSYRAKKWLQTVSMRGLASCGPSFSRFYSEVAEFFLDVAPFGQACMSSELKRDYSGFNDLCRSMSEVYHDINEDGEVDRTVRIWRTTVGKAKEKWTVDGKCLLSRETQAKKDDVELELMHWVLPSKAAAAQEFAPGDNKPFVAIYLECDQKHEIESEGYYENPFLWGFWARAAGERNGRGVGDWALPDTNSLQHAARDNLNAGARMARPPIMAPNEGVIKAIRVKPDSVIFGAMSPSGKQLLQPMNLGANVPYTMEQIQQLRDAVKDFFFFSLMQLVGRTGMTATEIIERQEERLRLMAPFVGRINEFLSAFLLRRYRMMARVPRLIPPPPPEMQGHSLQVVFTSPMAMVQKSQQATAVLRSWQAIQPMAALQPEILDDWDGVAASRIVAEGFGAPIDVWHAPEISAMRRQGREQQMAQRAMLENAELGARAARDGAAAVADTAAA